MMDELRTARLVLHRQTLAEMTTDMEAGDELACDFVHAYRYHQENTPDYDVAWLRLWQFRLLGSGAVIGGACFKGAPDKRGEVEIGYGIDEAYQRQGYGAEAVGALVRWASAQPGVNAVIAEIDESNLPSQALARRVGMQPLAGREDMWGFAR